MSRNNDTTEIQSQQGSRQTRSDCVCKVSRRETTLTPPCFPVLSIPVQTGHGSRRKKAMPTCYLTCLFGTLTMIISSYNAQFGVHLRSCASSHALGSRKVHIFQHISDNASHTWSQEFERESRYRNGSLIWLSNRPLYPRCCWTGCCGERKKTRQVVPGAVSSAWSLGPQTLSESKSHAQRQKPRTSNLVECQKG